MGSCCSSNCCVKDQPLSVGKICLTRCCSKGQPMGTGKSLWTCWCCSKSQSPKPITPVKPSPRKIKDKATSPINPSIPIIPLFEHIVNQPITFQTDITQTKIKYPLIANNYNQRKPQDNDWKSKLYTHGHSSDVVANIHNQTHECVSSSISKDIDNIIYMLHAINTEADEILKKRNREIGAVEQDNINQSIIQRKNDIEGILNNARSSANTRENYHRQLIEEFVKKLELEMADYLDGLHRQIAGKRASIIRTKNTEIYSVTEQGNKAREIFRNRLHDIVVDKRKEIMNQIDTELESTTEELIGYEQRKKIEIELYSTVGTKKEGLECENIPDRQKFIDDIHKVKPNHTTKRTVYIY